jgi:hypothetical protein
MNCKYCGSKLGEHILEMPASIDKHKGTKYEYQCPQCFAAFCCFVTEARTMIWSDWDKPGTHALDEDEVDHGS